MDKSCVNQLAPVRIAILWSERGNIHDHQIPTSNALALGMVVHYASNPRGKGKITGMKMIKRLREIDTDDDMFPEYEIQQIQDTISWGEWFNHPEIEEKRECTSAENNDPETERHEF